MPARLGQHFLIDEGARDAIVAASSVKNGEAVLEIGPGRGFLTEGLLAAEAQVTAVEMDERLAQGLCDKWGANPLLHLVASDFLKLDLAGLGDGPFKIVANLPYSVASPILQKVLPWARWTAAVLMFQREVAERVTAEPGGADYGLLSLSVAIHAEAEKILDVPRESFSPRPKIASAVVRLVRRAAPLVSPENQPAFFKVARAAFGQRRKMAANPLAQALKLPRVRVVEALGRCGVEPQARAETIPLEAWLRLPGELGLDRS
ncbi:MAG: ribosomal RNA small subunit methyltransferase A [Elusimicrobia bacterium]|nr:ribosomal RNA small subunit methyltransferase A [Elusimicrobiota bacterium]